MNLSELKIKFESIQKENSIDKLLEHRFNLQIEEGEMHVYLHSLDDSQQIEKSETKSIIGSIQSIKLVINERIELLKTAMKDQKRKEREAKELKNKESNKAERKFNIEESKFVLAAKRLLDGKTYKAILKASQDLPHSKINNMKRKNLENLIEDID